MNGARSAGRRAMLMAWWASCCLLVALTGSACQQRPTERGSVVAEATPTPVALPTASPRPLDDPRQMAGWGGLIFGMPEDEAAASLAATSRTVEQKIKNQRGQIVWALGPEVIDGIPFEPRVRFTGSPPKVSSITLFCPEGLATLNAYDRLQALLKEQLGNTSAEKTNASSDLSVVINETVWSFPRVTVEVNFLGSGRKPGNALLVSYRDPGTLAK